MSNFPICSVLKLGLNCRLKYITGNNVSHCNITPLTEHLDRYWFHEHAHNILAILLYLTLLCHMSRLDIISSVEAIILMHLGKLGIFGGTGTL